MTNAWGNTYSYQYDKLHNLTRINFPDNTYKALSYNKDKDWVTSFTDRKGCKEVYKYEADAKNPLNHYTSYVEKTCKGKVTNISSYEFLYKQRKDSSRYLARTISNNNNDITDISYHEVFGKPTSILKNGVKVLFEYYSPKHKYGGLLKRKSELTKTSTFNYKNSCQKVSQVITHYYQVLQIPKDKKPATVSKNLKRKLIRKITTDFKYNKVKCNLSFAENSIGQTAQITYDQRGRIKTIKDQARKIVNIKYEERFGKPSKVIRPGLGSIHVSYKSDGSINKVKSKKGPTVAVQVANIFNNLLDIISPAASELTL